MKFRILLLALTLSGCSKFLDKFSRLDGGSTTLVQFDATQRGALPATVDGGLIVYALNVDNGQRIALKLNSDADSTPFPLPNGNYTFRAVGWTTANMGGLLKCGANTGGTVPLTGANTTVNLAVGSSACLTTQFVPAAYINSSLVSPPNIVFCDSATNVGAKTYGADCASGEESSRFLRPNVTSASLVDRIDFDSATGRVVYAADPFAGTRQELFSVKTDGTGLLRESTVQPSIGREVPDFQVVKNKNTGVGTGKVVFTTDGVTNGTYELYTSGLGTPAAIGVAKATLISGAINGSVVSSPGVKAFKLSPDGTKAVFVGSMDNNGVVEVYVVDLSNNARTKLSHASPLGAGSQSVYEDSFKISPDGNYVIFSGQFETATTSELYSVPIAGGTIRKLSTPSPLASSAIRSFEINFDSTKVVWQADSSVASRVQTFASLIYPATPDPKDVSGAVGYTGTSGNRIALARDADLVAYTATLQVTNRFDLWVANFSNVNSITTEVVFDNANGGLNVANNNYHEMKFVTNTAGTSRRLVFLADSTTLTKYEVYAKLANFSSAPTLKVSHTISNGITPGGPGLEPNLRVMDYDKAYYLGDTTGDPGELHLYEADLGSAASGVLRSQNTNVDTLNTMGVGYGRVFYGYSSSLSPPYLPYMYTPGGTYSVMPVGLIGALSRVMTPPGNELAASYPYALFLQAKATGSATVQDYFFVSDYASPNPVKVSHLWGTASGEGRVVIRLLTYASNGSPNLNNVGDGLSSGCINPPAADGSATAHSFRVPYGASGGTSPFALAIDVYANASGCTGSFQRTIFPYGLADIATSSDPTKVKITDSGGNVKLFLRD